MKKLTINYRNVAGPAAVVAGLVAGFSPIASGQDLTPSDKITLTPHAPSYELESEFNRQYQSIIQENISVEEKKAKLEAMMAEWEKRQKLEIPMPKENAAPTAPPSSSTSPKPKPARTKSTYRPRRPSYGVEPLMVFYDSDSEGDNYVLNAGTYIRGTLLSGVDAFPNELSPVLIELDGIAYKPNGAMLDLRGCRIIAKVKGNLSNERALFETNTLSCSSEDNDKDFEYAIRGFATGTKHNHLGLDGRYESRQGRVFAAAVIAKLAEGAGKAVAMSQVAETFSGGENPVKARNIKGGDLTRYTVAQSTASAGEMIAEWYLNEAKKLMPFIGIDSSREVWIVVIEGISIPRDLVKEIP